MEIRRNMDQVINLATRSKGYTDQRYKIIATIKFEFADNLCIRIVHMNWK